MGLVVLVHSPLVGPATWSWTAAELHQRSQRVVVPSLLEAAASGSWQACVDAVHRAVPSGEEAVLVGHSGAGPLLPVIAAGLAQPPALLVFVDATLPPLRGEARLVPDQFVESLRSRARNGVLPRWSDWFGAGTMEAMVSDPGRRNAVVAELPELPLSYFDGRIPIPDDWADSPGAYLRLSDPYRPAATQAAARGWPVTELPGGHLDIVTRPGEVAKAILDLAGQGRRAQR